MRVVAKVIRIKRIASKIAQGTVVGTAMTVILLICILVCGLYIVYNIESAMTSTGCFTDSSWYTIYQNFVNTVQTVFTLLPVAIIVIVAGFIPVSYTHLTLPTTERV